MFADDNGSSENPWTTAVRAWAERWQLREPIVCQKAIAGHDLFEKRTRSIQMTSNRVLGCMVPCDVCGCCITPEYHTGIVVVVKRVRRTPSIDPQRLTLHTP